MRFFKTVAALIGMSAIATSGCALDAEIDVPDIDIQLDFNGIAQAVPPSGSENVPPHAPVIVFADGVYGDVSFTVEATVDGTTTDITEATVLNEIESGAAKDVFIISPLEGFPLGAEIKVTLGGEIDREVTFTVSSTVSSEPADLDFEASTSTPQGWTALGDVDVIGRTGSLSPAQGNNMLALSTGVALGGRAITDTSSYAVSSAIDAPTDATTLSFDYNFQSSEFDDFCMSPFDDTFLVIATGPEGSTTKMVDSVNVVCEDGRQVNATFPGMPDGGDTIYRDTGSSSFTMDISEVGSPVVLTLVVTDVGDNQLSSLVGVDRITIE